MKKGYLALLIALMFTVSSAFAVTADEAKAMVTKAVAYYKANGKEKALAEFSNPKGEFVKGELYLTVWDFKGTQIAHGSNPKLIGKNLLDLKDTDGKLFVKEFMDVAKKGNGWVDYKWTNPETKKIQAKTVYLEAVEETLIGCGIYK